MVELGMVLKNRNILTSVVKDASFKAGDSFI